MDSWPRISVVIPTYRGAAMLPSLVKRLGDALQGCASTYELIIVNDASPDNSWEVIRQIAESESWVQGINMMRNFGQHNALLAGMRAAQHEIIITMDDDLQHPPEEIPILLAKLNEGFDVVYGTPQSDKHDLGRTLASQVIKLTMQATMGVASARNVSAFRAIRREVCSAFAGYQSPYVNIDVLLSWGTTRFGAAAVRHDPRAQGKSNYNFTKLFAHTMNMLTGFSTLPLQFASFVGFLFTLLGIVVLIYVVGRYLILGYSVPGFPFLASTIAIFSGAQLFALGIIGEYLARMHFRIMDRPPYAIRSTTRDVS